MAKEYLDYNGLSHFKDKLDDAYAEKSHTHLVNELERYTQIHKHSQAYPSGKTTNPYHLVAQYTQSINNAQMNTSISFYVSEFFSAISYGILNIRVRFEVKGSTPSFCNAAWSLACNIDPNNFILTYKVIDNVATIRLYCKRTGWASYAFNKIEEQSWGGEQDVWVCLNSIGINDNAYVSIPNDETQIISTIQNINNGVSWNQVTNKPTIPTVPTNVSSFTNDSGYITSAHEKNNPRNIEFIKTTNTAASGALTGVSEDSELYDGKTIFLFLSYAAGASATLNLTLSDGTQTGAKPLYYTGTTRMTTHYGAGSVVSLTYVESVDGWRRADYDTNGGTSNQTFYSNAGFTFIDTTFPAFYGGTDSGYKRISAGTVIDISYPLLYRYTATAFYMMGGAVAIRTVTGNSSLTFTNGRSVYLVGTLSGKEFTVDNSILTDTLPTTEDGKIYIWIGFTYSTTVMWFNFSNPIMYYYKDGAIREYAYIPSASIDTAITNAQIDAIVNGTSS